MESYRRQVLLSRPMVKINKFIPIITDHSSSHSHTHSHSHSHSHSHGHSQLRRVNHAPFANRPAHFAQHRPAVERRVFRLRFRFRCPIGPLGHAIEDYNVAKAPHGQGA